MTSLILLKHTYNESDESVVERWAQDVYCQYFSGLDYFEAKKPCDPTQIGRFRTAIVGILIREIQRKEGGCLSAIATDVDDVVGACATPS